MAGQLLVTVVWVFSLLSLERQRITQAAAVVAVALLAEVLADLAAAVVAEQQGKQVLLESQILAAAAAVQVTLRQAATIHLGLAVQA